jgi:hypothetical protein
MDVYSDELMRFSKGKKKLRQRRRRSGPDKAISYMTTDSKSHNDFLVLTDWHLKSDLTPLKELKPYAYMFIEERGITSELPPQFKSTLFNIEEYQMYSQGTRFESRSLITDDPLLHDGQHSWLHPLPGQKLKASKRSPPTPTKTKAYHAPFPEKRWQSGRCVRGEKEDPAASCLFPSGGHPLQHSDESIIVGEDCSFIPLEEEGRSVENQATTVPDLTKTSSRAIKGLGIFLSSVITFLFSLFSSSSLAGQSKTDSICQAGNNVYQAEKSDDYHSSPCGQSRTYSSQPAGKSLVFSSCSSDKTKNCSDDLDPAETKARSSDSAAQTTNLRDDYFHDINLKKGKRPCALFRGISNLFQGLVSLAIPLELDLIDINYIMAVQSYSKPIVEVPRIFKGVDFDEYFSGRDGTISRLLTKKELTTHFKAGIDKQQHQSHDLTDPTRHKALWGKTLGDPPVVMMAWLPCRLWTPVCVTDYSYSELTAARKEEFEWIVKPVINACINQHKASRYFLIEQESSSKLMNVSLMKAMIKLTGARLIKINQSSFGHGHNKESTFITNIPDFLLKPITDKSSSNVKFHEPLRASDARKPVYYQPLLAAAIAETISEVVKYHRSTVDMLQVDVMEAVIRYIDKLSGVESSAIADCGCQHGIANVEHWRVTKNSGRVFSAKGFVGKSVQIEIGNCAAVAKDSRGNDILVLWNNVGLVKNMNTLLDPYQLMFGGCDIECIVSKRTPSPFIHKAGVVLPLSVGKDVTLDVRYPTDAELKNLPRFTLTADQHWDRAAYMASPHVVDISSVQFINSSKVSNKSKPKTPEEKHPDLDQDQSDSDSDDDFPYDSVNGQHTLPSKIWFWLDKNVLRRTAQASTAYVASRRGQDVLVRRTTHPATAQRRLPDKASHDTLFSTVPAKGCGSMMLQVFATRKSRYLFGVPIKSKDQVFSATEDFFQEVGIPTALRSDNAPENHSVKMKALLRSKEVSEEFSEEFLQFQNRVERWIGFLKRSVFKVLQKTGAPADEWLMCAMYVIACHNKTARKGLHWRTPWEMVFGDTPDISELVDYSFYQSVYYVHDPNDKGFPTPPLHQARYLGPACRHGSVMTHWIRLPDGSKIAKSLLRADNDARNQEEEEDSSDVKVTEDQLHFKGSDSKLSKSRGGSPKDPEEDLTSDQAEEVEEADDDDDDEAQGGDELDAEEPALTSVINDSVWIKDGRTQVIATAVKETYEGSKRFITVRMQGKADQVWSWEKFNKLRSVKDKNRDTLVPFSFVSFGKFKVAKAKKGVPSRILIKVGWSDGSFTWEPFENLKEDDSVSLAGYAIKAFKNPSYSAYKKNRVIIDTAYKWASQFLVANNACLNSLSARNPNVKFGVGLPKGIRGAMVEDAQYEQDEFLSSTVQHQRWSKAMEKEQANFDKHDAFQYLPRGTPPPRGYQQMRCHFVFDVKSDGKFKARFCAGGDSVDATGVDSAMTVVETPSTRILFVIAEANAQEVLVGDLSSAYLHAYTKEKVYFICGPEWGKEKEGCIAVVVKAVYGLVGSAHAYHQHVFETMSSKGWKCSEIDSDIWMRKAKTSEGTFLWEYVAFYVDDFIIVSRDPAKIGKELNAIFSVKEITEPNKYLGANVKFVEGRFQFSSEDYLKEILSQLRGEGNIPNIDEKRPDGIRKFKTPMATHDHPEMDDSDLLNEREHRIYQRLMGILQWLVSLGRFDICYTVSSLSRFNSAPRVGHMNRAIRVFGYLEQTPKKSIVINCDDLTDLPAMDTSLHADMMKKYPDAVEERSTREPEMLGKALNLTVFADADHAHDQVTRKSITGIIVFIGSTPIIAKSTRQGSVESSTYSAEFNSARAATELIIGLRLLLRSLGIPQDKPSLLLGDNLGVVQNATLFTSALKKKHNAISFHRVREAVAAGIISYAHIDTALNLADIFTKPLDSVSFSKLRDSFLNRVSVLPWTDAIVDEVIVDENERAL